MPDTSPISDVRDNMSDVFSRAVQSHAPVFIKRGRRELGSLLGLEELARLVAAYEFHPEVLLGDGEASIWLPEFALYGHGGSFEEARDDLVEEIREYVHEFLENAGDYLHAPNRSDDFPWVMRAAVADLLGGLLEAVFAEPSSTSEAGRANNLPTLERPAPAPSQQLRERHLLVSVPEGEVSAFHDLVKHRFAWTVCSVRRESGRTYAEEVAPMFGARPAHPRSRDD